MELQDVLNYCPDTGIFTWTRTVNARATKNSVAGTYDSRGYLKIGWKGKAYLAHRVAFYLMRGEFPEEQIDHINGDRSDNRWINLRRCVDGSNNQNNKRLKNNTSGCTGVSWVKGRNKWRAQLYINGKTRFLGHFDDRKVAEDVYVNEKRKAHPLYNGRN